MNKYDMRWEEMYEYAKRYYEKYGNLEISQNFKTNDGYTYDENGSVNLGQWIINQRRSCDPESCRGQLLLKIGMRFYNIRNIISWEEMYEYAKRYYESHGNLEVPCTFITRDGYVYNENGNINLGRWIANQRQNCDSKSIRGKLLLKIGMRFERIRNMSDEQKTVNNLKWFKMYEFAKRYYEKNGNLKVSQKFKTNDGYTYDENGSIKLGIWISYQRQSCDPESCRGYLLSCIGMIWDSHKDRFNIVCLCYDYGIDCEKNSFVLKRLSFIEFKVKLDYLKDNCIAVVNDEGILHEIFSMSSINMKAKYGVSLEDLVNMYNRCVSK